MKAHLRVRILLAGWVLIVLLGSSSVVAAASLYGMQNYGSTIPFPQTLYRIDHDGSYAIVSNNCVKNIGGLAYNSNDGYLYGMQNYASTVPFPQTLYRIDPSDGSYAIVSNNCVENIGGLAYNSSEGYLYGIQNYASTFPFPQTLYRIDPSDGSYAIVSNNCVENIGGLAYVPKPTLLVDTGFRPSTNGFQFANWGYLGEWYGHCVGMTFAAFNYFALDIDPTSGSVWKQMLYIEWLQARYLLDSTFQNIADWLLSNLPMTSLHVQSQYALIRGVLQFGSPCPILLAPPLGGGHAVLAYKTEETSSGDSMIYTVYVYDNVHPGDDDRKLTIIDQNGNWIFSSGSIYTRFSVLEPSDLVGYTADMSLAYVLHSPVTLRITDPDGLTLDQHHCEFDGGYYRTLDIDDDGDEEKLAIILWPKGGEYFVNVIPDPGASPTEVFTLEEYKFGVGTTLARNVQVQDIPSEPYVSVALITATIEVEPDVLQLQSKGRYVTAFVELPIGYYPSEIDPTMVDVYMKDLSLMAESSPREIGDYDRDGILDLMVKFDRNRLIEAIREVKSSEYFELTVAGQLGNGTRFEGTGTIRLIN